MAGGRLKAIPYLRVSTDNKGQDPTRQMEVIGPWAMREAVEVTQAIVDDGTSASKTNPFERPVFLKACKAAKDSGAEGIVVETADRFTRQGSKEDGWAEIELWRRYGLKLFRADKALKEHGTFTGDLMDAMKAEVARTWVQEHAKKVKSGMAKKMREGLHVGRPRKELTAAELVQARAWQSEGWGSRRIAHELSRARGAFLASLEASERRKRSISDTTVVRALRASKSELLQN
jgi:DNA invertase Pin-like site-specific DNA recombinase